MLLRNLPTPLHALDMDALERNISSMAEACQGVELWPMAKTHKSTAIARMQLDAGAKGFLCGTLTEAEGLISIAPVMLAYPVAGAPNIARALKLIQRGRVILSFDGTEAATEMAAALNRERLSAEFLLIVDSGLHRFGVPPEAAASLCRAINQAHPELTFLGISTHPGQVYMESSPNKVAQVACAERDAMALAARLLAEAGFPCRMVATGSTPTARYAVKYSVFTALRPGNFAFYDATQLSLGSCRLRDCALTVEASVISNPSPHQYIIDAGAKSLALDRGAHGAANIHGYGLVLLNGKPQECLELVALSEEVGKVVSSRPDVLRVGQSVTIIPNHACPAANLAREWVLHRGGQVIGSLFPDLRS